MCEGIDSAYSTVPYTDRSEARKPLKVYIHEIWKCEHHNRARFEETPPLMIQILPRLG